MKEKALQYYRQGWNCSQCILKAAEAVYGLPVSRQCMNACTGVSTGFGVGGLCSVLIAGVMTLGLLFDEATVKRLRIKLFTAFHDKYKCTDCAALKAKRVDHTLCEGIVAEVAALVETIVAEER